MTVTQLLPLMAGLATAYVQVDLHQTKPQAFNYLSKEMDRVIYENHPFTGDIPWYPYSMNMGVGTPAQTQSMVVSLGHGDTFILYDGLCLPGDDDSDPANLRDCSSGSFDDEKSTTFSYNSTDERQYHFREYVAGVPMEDTITIGDQKMPNVSVLLATDTEIDTGILGLTGMWGSPAFVVDDNQTTILMHMVEQEIIDSPAFSFHAVHDNNETTGSILFGAVDKGKFDGDLQRVQASFARDKYASYRSTNDLLEYNPGYFVNVSSAWTASPGEEPRQRLNPDLYLLEESTEFYAAVDPTFAISNLPAYITSPIYEAIRPSIWYNVNLITVECNRTDLNYTLALELGGADGYVLNVTMQDLIVPAESWYLTRPPTEATEFSEARGEERQCLFGIQNNLKGDYFKFEGVNSPSRWVIGGLVLQNTYTVFDAANMEVALAPLRSSPGKEDIVSFEEGGHAPESSFVGTAECFENCEVKNEDEDAGDSMRVHRGLVAASLLGVVAWLALT